MVVVFKNNLWITRHLKDKYVITLANKKESHIFGKKLCLISKSHH